MFRAAQPGWIAAHRCIACPDSLFNDPKEQLMATGMVKWDPSAELGELRTRETAN